MDTPFWFAYFVRATCPRPSCERWPQPSCAHRTTLTYAAVAAKAAAAKGAAAKPPPAKPPAPPAAKARTVLLLAVLLFLTACTVGPSLFSATSLPSAVRLSPALNGTWSLTTPPVGGVGGLGSGTAVHATKLQALAEVPTNLRCCCHRCCRGLAPPRPRPS